MDVNERIEEQLSAHDVLLYMKGTPDFPQCGFSGQTVAALTAVAMISGRDFTFLRSFIMWGGMIALGTIIMGVVVGFHLGTYFSMAMIGLAGASILYDTSKILTVYPDDRYIAAALELFASIALMLWYVLRLFLSRR